MQTALDLAVARTKAWHSRISAANKARDELVVAIQSASDEGIPELRISQATGLTRTTIRRWLGKDQAKKLSQTA